MNSVNPPSEATLAARTCVPCQGGVPALTPDEIGRLLQAVAGWDVVEHHHLTREFTFPDFALALAFTNRVGAISEQEGHHPDVYLGWGKVRLEIWTHKIDGLTESDFILAAKCSRAYATGPESEA